MKQPAEFVDGDVDQSVQAGGADGGRGGEERVRGDDQGGPAVPGFPAAVLVLVQTEAGLGRLNDSSMLQRRPATVTRWCRAMGSGLQQR